ncbi:MAG: glycosyltransferase, partial [Chloroflexi bacterium]|nr:glycosyltransferase [Chloroflexota bacterium]
KEAPHLAVAKAQTIYFGADVGDLRDLMNRSDPSAGIQKHPGEIWAVYAGTLGSMYDIPTLLKSAHVLKQRAPMIKILIAGDGPQRQYLIDFVREHGLSNVTYLGTLPLSELARYYRLSDIALSPYHVNSTVEMPAKVYDYLAVGLPIVNSLRGELEGLIRNHAIGTQYTSGDVESLVRVLVELAQDEARRKEMAHNSFDLAMKFDRQTQYQKFLDILN